jgi:hypothetical protein
MILKANRKQKNNTTAARKSTTVKMTVSSPELAIIIATIINSVACIGD